MMSLFHTVVNPKDVIFIDGASLGGEDFCEFSSISIIILEKGGHQPTLELEPA